MAKLPAKSNITLTWRTIITIPLDEIDRSKSITTNGEIEEYEKNRKTGKSKLTDMDCLTQSIWLISGIPVLIPCDGRVTFNESYDIEIQVLF